MEGEGLIEERQRIVKIRRKTIESERYRRKSEIGKSEIGTGEEREKETTVRGRIMNSGKSGLIETRQHEFMK